MSIAEQCYLDTLCGNILRKNRSVCSDLKFFYYYTTFLSVLLYLLSLLLPIQGDNLRSVTYLGYLKTTAFYFENYARGFLISSSMILSVVDRVLIYFYFVLYFSLYIILFK